MTPQKKIYRYVLLIILVLTIMLIIFFSYKTSREIPDDIKVLVNDTDNFNFALPLSADISDDSIDAISISNNNFSSFSLSANETGTYNADLKLFGLISLKKINVEVIDNITLTPVGLPIGIYLETNGLLVLGTDSVTSQDGLSLSPAKNLVKTGDYVLSVNNTNISTKAEMIKLIQISKTDNISLSIRRKNEIIPISIKRVLTNNNDYKLGIWIRDNMQGIGTMTYMDEKNNYGSLGHGIKDIDTSILMNIDYGNIYSTDILDITKGKPSSPGELVGVINHSADNLLGNFNINNDRGIFGKLSNSGQQKIVNELKENKTLEKLPIGLKQNIEEGNAVIRCKLSDNIINDYTIKILKISQNSKEAGKDFLIKVTDEQLLSKTGGIVQGMSGSPIIQNNRIIGAVTHVLVKDSTMGYGIFIEKMLNS